MNSWVNDIKNMLSCDPTPKSEVGESFEDDDSELKQAISIKRIDLEKVETQEEIDKKRAEERSINMQRL